MYEVNTSGSFKKGRIEYSTIVITECEEVNIPPGREKSEDFRFSSVCLMYECIFRAFFYRKLEIAKCKLQIEQEEEALARWAGRGLVCIATTWALPRAGRIRGLRPGQRKAATRFRPGGGRRGCGRRHEFHCLQLSRAD